MGKYWLGRGKIGPDRHRNLTPFRGPYPKKFANLVMFGAVIVSRSGGPELMSSLVKMVENNIYLY